MHPILKDIIAIVIGVFLGSLVNGAIIMVSGSIVAPPAGLDITTEEGLKMGMHLMQPKHFILPFLAHAIGTFVGAYIAARFGAHQMIAAIIIGVLFLIGGIWMAMIVPSPVWFNMVDLLGAYLPVAYFAGRIARVPESNEVV